MLLRSMLVIMTALILMGAEEPSVTVHGPTIIAFFAPIKHPETAPDDVSALEQFKSNQRRLRPRLEKAGIELDEMYAATFQVRVGEKSESFDSGHMKIGYYFIVPGKEPRIEYGVGSAGQVIQAAREYFGITVE